MIAMDAAADASVKQGAVLLLELSAADNLPAFRRAVEEDGLGVDVSAPWYGRWGRRVGFQQRTPLMVAAAYGSTSVLEYILATGTADVNRACGTDGATALHCAVAGGSASCSDAVRSLVEASADADAVDALGNRPADVIPRNLSPGKARDIRIILKHVEGEVESPRRKEDKKGEKKEYPADLTLPDIKNGVYSTDEFRMYVFKVKPCSRAYSHDWTECPFAHPGENARRRDLRKHHYSCAPCPEFRKGACRSGDACEYAHGVFECWLHPAQYRTRLCKDEARCARRVCFFAHKAEELRPVQLSAPPSPSVSVLASPKSPAVAPLDMATAAALLLNQNSAIPSSSSSSAMAWLNQAGGVLSPPTLQLPPSRLQAALSVRNLDMDMDLTGLEAYQHQLADDIASLSSPSGWNSALSVAPAMDLFGPSLDSASRLSQFQGLSLNQAAASQFQIPRQSLTQHLLSLYSSSGALPSSASMRASLSSSPSSALGLGYSTATAMKSSKSSAFAKRSQSFCDRGAASRPSGLGIARLAAATGAPEPALSDWCSPDGKLDWGIQRDELSKLRKSASFGFRSNGGGVGAAAATSFEEPDVSWVQSLVKDGPSLTGRLRPEQQQQQQHQEKGNDYSSVTEVFPPWTEQLYAEPEQVAA